MADETVSEEWRPVEGWPFEVSSLGRVRRTRRGKGCKNPILKCGIDCWGYRRVTLRDKPRMWQGHVHILVCEAFHGPRPPAHEAAHWDGDKLNNVPDNLRWATSAENHDDMIRHGHSARGKRHHNTKLDEQAVREIRALLAEGYTSTQIHRRFNFGVSRSAILGIQQRRNWGWLPDTEPVPAE